MNGDVAWPWWLGLLIVCVVLLAGAWLCTRNLPDDKGDR